MKKAIKFFALLLAVLMLVTLTTACKKSDDDLNTLIGGNSTLNGNGSVDNGAGNEDAPGNEDEGGSSNNGGESNKNDSGSSDQGGNNSNSTPGTDEEKQQAIVENYDPTKKYEFASNPLFAESKKINTGVEPGYDIDTTGFVKNNIKIADLKGKTFTMITAVRYGVFSYHGPKGEDLNEWTWFEALKKTYGVNFKYIESRFDKAPQQIITYMNAGKALDIVPTHRAAFPQYLLLSQPLDPYINLQYVDNSPGIDSRTMEQTKWDDTYRCISPIGSVDVLWYNETMAKELGLQDPHKLWQQGKWDWDAWKNFVVGAPMTAPNGQTSLTSSTCSEGDAVVFYPQTNGVSVFEIATTNGKSTFVSNFKDPRALEAWVFFAETGKGLDSVARRTSGDPQVDMYRLGSVIMCGTTHLMVDCAKFPYAKTQKFNWVPYPKGPDKDGECICMNYGITMMVPKKVKNQSNIPYAVKLMEIWASRFTEAINDYLQEPQYKFTYAQRVEYFNFAAKTNYFGVGTRIFDVLTGDEYSYYRTFIASFYNVNHNTTTEAMKVYNLVDKAIEKMMTYGT